MIETSMIILCAVMAFAGLVVGWLVGLRTRVGCQRAHLEETMPIEKSYKTPDGEVLVPTHSIEEHLKVVNYMHRVLLSEEERIRDEL